MKRIFTFITVVSCLFFSETIFGQDVHYSQFYANPLNYNASMTGNFNGNYRVGLIARSQWKSVTTPYQTMSVYGDVALLQDERGKDNWIGVGGSITYDRAGDGVLTAFNAQGSVAFHKDITDGLYFSIGGAIGYTQKSVDFSRLSFNSQWNQTQFDPELFNQENFENNSNGSLDVNSGISFTYSPTTYFTINSGFSILHINRPKESFFFSSNVTGNNRRNFRPITNINLVYTYDVWSFQPGVFFSREQKAQELILGTNVAYDIGGGGFSSRSTSQLYLGMWYRTNDAVIALAGYDMNQYRFLISYDINTSELRSGSNSRGGFELSFVHIGGFRPKTKRMYCPRF